MIAAMSRSPSEFASTTIRRLAFSRRIWFGPSVSRPPRSAAAAPNQTASRSADRRDPRWCGCDPAAARRDRSRRLPSTSREIKPPVRQPFELIGDMRGLQAVERGPAVVDGDLELRDAHLPLDLQIDESRDPTSFWRMSSARPRRVSRSSPKIFSAICARTPDSMWSRRCEIGCPTLVDAGNTDRRLRMSAMISALRAAAGLQVDLDLGGMDALGMLVELGPARAAGDRFTSGTSRINRSAMSPTRWLSASEMPGWNSVLIVSVPSLKGGRNARGNAMSGGDRRDQHRKHRRRSSAYADARSTEPSSARLPRFSVRTSQPSRWSSRFRPAAGSRPSPASV